MNLDELDARADDAEKALIGAAAFHPDACASVLASLAPSAFHNPHREAVWAVMRERSAERLPFGPGHIAQALKTAGKWNQATHMIVTREMTEPEPAHHAAHHAELVASLDARRALLRQVKRVALIAAEDHYEPSELLGRIRAVFEDDAPAEREHGPMNWRALIDEFDREHDPDTARRVIWTPWSLVDRLLGGLHPGRMYIFGGRPGAGKSTAALVAAVHAARLGHETLVCSREMPSVDVTGRILARGAGVDVSTINSRRLSAADRQKIDAYVSEIGEMPLTVDAKPRNLAGIKTLARAHKHRTGLDVLVVDYLQLVHTDARSREQEVAQVSIQLKRLALELDCVVLLPAQLNRESLKRADQKPTMSDLRDSGQIEQDADVVILLHRPRDPAGHYTGEILFIIDKNRHGPTAELQLTFDGGFGDIT